MAAQKKSARLGLGWRVAIVLIGTVAIWTLMSVVALVVFRGEVSTASRIVCALIVFGLAVPMVVLARKHLDNRPWSTLGLQGWREGWRPFLIGTASFVVPSVIGLTVAVVAGWVRITSTAAPIGLLAGILFTVATVLLLEAVPEELIFRGYVYRNLSSAMAPLVAVLVQAGLFALLGTALWVVTTGWGVLLERGGLFLAMGVLLGILCLISGSVWNPIGFHLGFQVIAQSLLTNPAVQVDNAVGLTIAAIVPGFVFAVAITSFSTRRKPNWLTAEPDA